MREQIFEAIEEGRVDHTIFNAAQSHAQGLLRFSIFPLWKGSKEFQGLMKKRNITDLRELTTTGKKGKKNQKPDEMAILDTSGPN